jgi:uncharacterized protein YneF (UPF0154 family)
MGEVMEMDFKNYVQSNKQKQSQGRGGQYEQDVPMNDVEGQIHRYESLSKNDMMDELRRAKQSGSLNDQSLRQFMDAMGNNLTEQQRRNIINLVNGLK